MVHALTGWDLDRGEHRCDRCVGAAELFNIAHESEELQQLKRAKTTEFEAMNMHALKRLCTNLHLKTSGNKATVVERLVAEHVAAEDPRQRHAQYRRQLADSRPVESTPPMYLAYREHFNAVDIFNRRFYCQTFPKTMSEMTHIFFGMITIALVNSYTISHYYDQNSSYDAFIKSLAQQLSEKQEGEQ